MKRDPATGHWEYGAIDWAEFKQVLAGNGPCNRDRMRRGGRRMTRALGARGGRGLRGEAQQRPLVQAAE